MEELSGECRKAFPANETSLQAAAVRHRHLLQAVSALDMLMLLLGNLCRLQVPKKEKYKSGLKYYSNDIIHLCYTSRFSLKCLQAEALKQTGKQVCLKYDSQVMKQCERMSDMT